VNAFVRRLVLGSIFLTASASTFAAEPAPGDAEILLKKYACVACHAARAKVVGRSCKDVAAKYRGHHDSAKVLAEKVRNGGSGVWSAVPMPPNPNVRDADLQTIIAPVLATK
jgi:cytochrome c551/c552